jgi:hypothetical protein
VKIYTISFRKIRELTRRTGLVRGDNFLQLNAADMVTLSKGVYYYVVFAEDSDGKKARSKAEQFVILK